MPFSNQTAPDTPAAQSLGALHGLAALLHCVDPDRWNSLARPHASDLAALTQLIHDDLSAVVGEDPRF